MNCFIRHTASVTTLLCLFVTFVASPSFAEFSFEQDGGRLSILEDGALVTVYNFADPSEKDNDDSDLWERSNYFYPVIGMHGENVTSNYPSDHIHHRGIFWCWPECSVGDKRLDMWLLQDTRYAFQHLQKRANEDGSAQLSIVNSWVYKDDSVPIVNEEVTVDFLPAADMHRIIDFTIKLTNVHQHLVTIQGATNKGYGGFKFRLDADRKPFTIVGAEGTQKRDTWLMNSPWVDASWTTPDQASEKHGVSIFQHPDNPDYPHDGWMIRHYGIVGPAWPHEQKHLLKTGESVTLQYRLVLHSGSTEAADVAGLHAEYAERVGR